MAFLAQGKHIVLISDSGMPALSDPGNLLINSVADNGYDIEIIPSASAYSTALIRSGLGDRRHLFLGFLPKYSLVKFDTIFNTWQRHWQIDNDLLILCYESPHRIKKTLGYLKVLEIKYDLRLKVSIARELTKKHEQVISGSVEDVLSNVVEKGEMVLIIGQN
jgi:16S rRNA (cytidine1402-2'-O)-methyltransferase